MKIVLILWTPQESTDHTLRIAVLEQSLNLFLKIIFVRLTFWKIQVNSFIKCPTIWIF